jgi:hypothetical protein
LNAPQNLTYFQLSSGYQIPALTRELALVQTGLNQAVVACALERYRMAVGRYPETLDKLRPRYLDRLPNDLCNGRPLHYLRPSAQDFVLYSVGWNEQDDSGVSRNEADWVWKYPP